MPDTSAVTIILLAGGKARRLPGKLNLPLDGEPLLVNTYKRLTVDHSRPCIISVREELDASLRQALPAPAVTDEFENCGPLGGLLSAATHVKTPLFFAAAADLPFISAGFIDRLEHRYTRNADEVTVPPSALLPRSPEGKLEPLAALYVTADFISGARAALERGERKVTAALAGRTIAYFDVAPAQARELMNINTAEDWQRLRA